MNLRLRARPTWQGLAVAVAAIAGIAMAGFFGARALNALVAPALVALGIAGVRLALVDRPALERIAPGSGSVGDRREISLRIDADRSVLATVDERVPDLLVPERTRFEAVIGTGTTLTYGIEPDERGVYDVGPAVVTVTDPFGLFVRRFRYPTTTPIAVHPPVCALSGPGRDDLSVLSEVDRARRRHEFDGIREYERGDALRDVHWKTTAKRPSDGLLVKRFAVEGDPESLTIAASGDPRHADALASATASLAEYLFDAGVDVGLVVADGTVPAAGDAGKRTRREILALLARTDGGIVPRRDREHADVVIEAGDDGVTVTGIDGRTTFERLAGEPAPDPQSRSARAVGSA